MEHHKAICVLVGVTNVSGSAFALLRSQFEAYVRGLWFCRCATDAQIKEFIAGKEAPKINLLISAIEETPDYKHGALKRKKQAIWKNLSEYTHGGFFQVGSRITHNEIADAYREEDIVWL